MSRPQPEVVEMSLLLPAWQASALEAAARHRGMTTAQMIRRLIGELVGPPHTPPADRPSPSPASAL